jgi:hypothetical protein
MSSIAVRAAASSLPGKLPASMRSPTVAVNAVVGQGGEAPVDALALREVLPGAEGIRRESSVTQSSCHGGGPIQAFDR